MPEYTTPTPPSMKAGQTPPKLNRGKKILLGTTLSIVGAVALIFVCFFVYYTWQFKYGDPEKIQKIGKQISNSKFTLADSGKQQKAEADKPVTNFVRPHNPVFGNPKAKVTIVEFIDFECPFSQASFSHFQTIKENYGSAVKFVFKHMPLSSIHPNAMPAALASQCAHEQGKFWEYYRVLFETKKLDGESLLDTAADLGLNTETFSKCLETQKYSKQIQDDVVDGLELDVRGTPTYFVNQQIVEGVYDVAAWNTRIQEHLK